MARRRSRPPIGDPLDPRGFEVLLGRYLEHLEVKHYSPRTITSAREALRRFGRWCEERGATRPGEITRSHLERYQRWLYHYRKSNDRPLAPRTQNQWLARVKTFFRWLAKERYVLYDPAASLELPKPPPRLPTETFSIEEVEQILATPDIGTTLGLRDRAILESLYATGLRRAEVAALDIYDLDRDRGWLSVRQGKGGRDRVVPMGERALAWTMHYLETSRPELVLHGSEWTLFLTASGSRFSPETLGHCVRKILRASDVRPRRYGNCHLFRHTMATQMLEAGADIRYIQEMLGHAKLETTEVYTRVSIQRLAEVHAATHPGAKLERTRDVDLLDGGEDLEV